MSTPWMARDHGAERAVSDCVECGLPDLHDGQGDGIGSCECPRCEWCGAAPWECDCESEDLDWRPRPVSRRSEHHVGVIRPRPSVVTVDTRGLT